MDSKVQTPALLLTSCVTLGKWLHFVPQRSHLQEGLIIIPSLSHRVVRRIRCGDAGVSFSSVLGTVSGTEKALSTDSLCYYNTRRCFRWYKRELTKRLPSKSSQTMRAGK